MNKIIIVTVFIVVITMIYGEKTSFRPSSQTIKVPYHSRHSSFRLEHNRSPTFSPTSNHTSRGDYCSRDGFRSTGCIVEIVLISLFLPCIFLCIICNDKQDL